MKLQLGVITEEDSWKSLKDIINKKTIAEIIKIVLNHFPIFKNAIVEVAVLLTNDLHMQKLNKEFLGKDKSTNILSFPDREINRQDLLEFSDKKEYIYIGDMALGFDIINLESKTIGVGIYQHIAHLIVHSTLHLLGYDHECEREAEEMMILEIELLKKLGIESPY